MSKIFTLCLFLLSLNTVNLEHVVNNMQTEKNRIFHGHRLSHDAHKYLVKLDIVNQYKSGSFCSGSILTPRWVITAAHCIAPDLVEINVEHYKRGRMKVIGEVDSRQIVWHPEYEFGDGFSEGNRAFDVALLKTRKAMKFKRYVQPIMLASMSPSKGQLAVMTGYGENDRSNGKATEGTVVLTECSHEGLLCSREVASAGNGDSGGALVVRGRLAGVTAASCLHTQESTPCLTVFVDVARNAKWIKKVIES